MNGIDQLLFASQILNKSVQSFPQGKSARFLKKKMTYENICFNCGKVSEKKLNCCSRCKLAHYCSVECQRSDWNIHLSECPRKDYVFKELLISKNSMHKNVHFYMSKFDKYDPEKIWKTLVYACSEPFSQRNIYNRKTKKWIEKYPNSREYFRNKILALVKNYVKNKKKISFADVEKKLRKESELYNLKEQIIQNDTAKLIQKFFISDKFYFNWERKLSKFQRDYFLSLNQSDSCQRKLFSTDVKDGDIVHLNTTFPIYLSAALPRKELLIYSKIVDAFDYDECPYVLDVIVDISPNYYTNQLPFRTKEANMEKLKDAGILTAIDFNKN